MCVVVCIASGLLFSLLKVGVLDPRVILLSLRMRVPATIYLDFIKLNTQHIEFCKWQKRDAQNWIVLQKHVSERPTWSRSSLTKRQRESPRVLQRRPPATAPASLAAPHEPPVKAVLTELGELKAGVHADGVAQLVTQDALLAVVGQLEQVEACRRRGKSTTGLLLADCEKAPKNAAEGVSGVLDTGNAPLVRTFELHQLTPFLFSPDHLKLPHNGWRKVV